MRLGLISDVHSDASALDRALTVLERRGAARERFESTLTERSL